jgi:hypothetical protein
VEVDLPITPPIFSDLIDPKMDICKFDFFSLNKKVFTTIIHSFACFKSLHYVQYLHPIFAMTESLAIDSEAGHRYLRAGEQTSYPDVGQTTSAHPKVRHIQDR